MMKRRTIIYGIAAVILIIAGSLLLNLTLRKKSRQSTDIHQAHQMAQQREVLYYTCGMHPSVRVSPEEYQKGKTKDPICGMDLVPVYKEEAAGKDVLKLSSREIFLTGIETFKIKQVELFKEIRTVGVVAYDPALRTAEEEYIQALNTYEKISQSGFEDAVERSEEILEASRLKLKVLGLTEGWIEELNMNKKPHDSLILPEEYMWVYADIYEYEAAWPKMGDRVEITSLVEPSIVFKGEIVSVEPIVKEKTRSLKLKILVENKEGILKPNMYVDVFLKSDLGKVLSVPKDAVLDTGKRKIAFVDLGEGRYQLREVRVGPLAQGVVDGRKLDFYPLVGGMKENEAVVLKGNYLLDSQSQLGQAGAVYGGALEVEGQEAKPPAGHVH
jgi:hypothetical protein